MSRTIAYRPEIDGLRTIAVGGVIIFHLNNDWLKGGFLGVDVFFVISGFLITSIIYSKMLKGSFSLTDFWKRRIMRLYPALAAMVGVILLVGAYLLIPPEREKLPLQALAAIFSFENILLWQTTGGYWDSSSENILLLHAWSLSLEEQFYLCFPVFLLFIFKLARKNVKQILFIVFLLSILLCFYATENHRNATFYLLPTRMWELLCGGILALYHINNAPRSDNSYVANIFQITGVLLIILSFITIANDEFFPGFWPIIPCIGTLLLINYGSNNGPVKSFLSLKPVVYLGKISYSLYLWHWPIIVFLRYTNPTLNVWIALSLTFIFAIASYHLVENPFRRGFAIRPKIKIAAAAGTVSACFIPILILQSSPLLLDLGNINSEITLTKGRECEATEQIREGKPGLLVSGSLEKVDIALIGSSHARVLCSPLKKFAERENMSFLSLTTTALEITHLKPTKKIPDAYKINQSRLNNIAKIKPKVTIVGGRWSTAIDNKEFESVFTEKLKFLSKNSKEVLVVGQWPLIKLPPEYKKALRKYLIANRLNGNLSSFPLMTKVDSANRKVEKIINSLNVDNIHYINTYNLFIDPNKDIVLVKDGKFLYSDYNHINNIGATLVFDSLLQKNIKSWLN